MKGVVRLRAAARRDLIAIYRYDATEAGPRVADRFLADADRAFERLAGMPGMGTAYRYDHPALAEVRYFPISSRFKLYLVFYQPSVDGIAVVRVLHGGRDIAGILGEEFGVEDDEGGHS